MGDPLVACPQGVRVVPVGWPPRGKDALARLPSEAAALLLMTTLPRPSPYYPPAVGGMVVLLVV